MLAVSNPAKSFYRPAPSDRSCTPTQAPSTQKLSGKKEGTRIVACPGCTSRFSAAMAENMRIQCPSCGVMIKCRKSSKNADPGTPRGRTVLESERAVQRDTVLNFAPKVDFNDVPAPDLVEVSPLP